MSLLFAYGISRFSNDLAPVEWANKFRLPWSRLNVGCGKKNVILNP